MTVGRETLLVLKSQPITDRFTGMVLENQTRVEPKMIENGI